jgi:hypothetical protein
MMGRSGASPAELPAALDQAATVMGILELLADPERFKQAVKALGDATKAYQDAKDAADKNAADFEAATKAAEAALDKRVRAVEKAEAELQPRVAQVEQREVAVQKREDTMGAREAKIRAAFA